MRKVAERPRSTLTPGKLVFLIPHGRVFFGDSRAAGRPVGARSLCQLPQEQECAWRVEGVGV